MWAQSYLSLIGILTTGCGFAVSATTACERDFCVF